VPVALDGLYEIWPRSRPLRWLALQPFTGARVKFHIGRPLDPPAAAAGSSLEKVYDAHTERLLGVVREMFEGMK